MAAVLARTMAHIPMTGPEATSAALEVLEGLEEFMATAAFLHKLENVREEFASHESAPPLPAVGLDVDTAEAALAGSLPDLSAADEPQQQQHGLLHHGQVHTPAPDTLAGVQGEEEYVVVDKEDAVEAMAYFIAVYLNHMPEAARMEPKQLQAAITQAMHQMHKSRFRTILDYGRHMYRFSAIGYSALQLYENPWVVRALATAVWASGKLAWGALGLAWAAL